MNDFLNVTALAILQGVAEFLPISSSGHLVILQHILEVPESLRLKLEVVLHAGTLVAVFAFYARAIGGLLGGVFRSGERGTAARLYAGKLLLSTLPAILVYGLFHDAIESLISNARMVGALLMFTGAVLAGTRFLPKGERDVSFLRALWMGLAQALALLPGVSRSGMTLVAARTGKVEPARAAEFSFLMSSPLILGGLFLELFKDAPADGASLPTGLLIYGALLAAGVGYVSLVLLVKALKGKWFWLFGPYCLLVGLITLCCCG